MLGRNILVHLWQVVLFILGVQVVVLAVTGVSSPGEALAYLASACLIGVACFHAAVLSAGPTLAAEPCRGGRRWPAGLVDPVADARRASLRPDQSPLQAFHGKELRTKCA